MPNDPTTLVRQGYDVIAQRYLRWARPSPTRARYLAALRHTLPAQCRVLEIGCGAGLPVARALAESAEVVGVDLSATQIALARQAIPQATFIEADINQLDFAPATFAAVVSFYAITHIPRTQHAELFARIARWLQPGGRFVASLGANDSPDMIEPDWLGVPMFFSHFDAATNVALLHQAGFHLAQAEVVAEDEEGVAVPFLWVLAQMPPTDPHNAGGVFPERP